MKNRSWWVAALGVGVACATAPAAWAASGAILCPMSGKPVDFAMSARTDAGPAFFCCKKCLSRFKSDPAKYAEEVAKQRVILAKHDKVQVLCPVTGKPVDAKSFIEQDGKKVRFCREACIEDYKKDPAKYQANLANGYTYQTMCPVSGKTIKPGVFSEFDNGMKVYYCCKGCIKKFESDPGKYAEQLESQGITTKVEKLTKTAEGDGHDRDHPRGNDKGDDGKRP